MPKAYWVVTYRSMKNPDAWKAYAKLARPAIESSGGRFLALNDPAKPYEAGFKERVVLVEFDSLNKALACHDTPAYKEALKVLGTGNVERDMRVVEGKKNRAITSRRTENACAFRQPVAGLRQRLRSQY